MPASHAETTVLHALVRRRHRVEPERLWIERVPLRGGLEAADVEQLSVRYRVADGSDHRMVVVAKRLAGAASREAVIYERLVAPHAASFSPRLHAVEHTDDGHTVLYLEALRAADDWPWRERRVAQSVLDRAAQLHACEVDHGATVALAAWDYEAELQHTAWATLACLEEVRRQPLPWRSGGAHRWTRRVVQALPVLRRELLAFEPLGRAVIHGDLHPGNVVMRRRDGQDDGMEPVLLDWGRTRMGSPLEDVSCWLQSLGAWEPEARRRHDTLLAGYLAARGLEPRLGAELRAAYWLAGASNALSGALLHHLSVLLDSRRPDDVRATAAYAAREWVRVLRRAAAYWC